ncbi:hypothetical protein B0H14DRAFT_2644611 [Mycena olivaceomarginata]|nr:hypothetical protein B0H14DRAFT_2644611 [Mycena olivaceomarginata]
MPSILSHTWLDPGLRSATGADPTFIEILGGESAASHSLGQYIHGKAPAQKVLQRLFPPSDITALRSNVSGSTVTQNCRVERGVDYKCVIVGYAGAIIAVKQFSETETICEKVLIQSKTGFLGMLDRTSAIEGMGRRWSRRAGVRQRNGRAHKEQAPPPDNNKAQKSGVFHTQIITQSRDTVAHGHNIPARGTRASVWTSDVKWSAIRPAQNVVENLTDWSVRTAECAKQITEKGGPRRHGWQVQRIAASGMIGKGEANVNYSTSELECAAGAGLKMRRNAIEQGSHYQAEGQDWTAGQGCGVPQCQHVRECLTGECSWNGCPKLNGLELRASRCRPRILPQGCPGRPQKQETGAEAEN